MANYTITVNCADAAELADVVARLGAPAAAAAPVGEPQLFVDQTTGAVEERSAPEPVAASPSPMWPAPVWADLDLTGVTPNAHAAPVDPTHTTAVAPAVAAFSNSGEPATATVDVVPQQSGGAIPVPEMDKRGFPWDERIHTSSKAVNKDGTWRYRRNTPQETITAVEAELHGASTPAPVADDPLAPVADDPLAIPAFMQRTPEPTPAPTAAPEPGITYAQLVTELTDASKPGPNGEPAKMDSTKFTAFFAELGISGIADLVSDPVKTQLAHAKLASL